jgi:hypothetical protein
VIVVLAAGVPAAQAQAPPPVPPPLKLPAGLRVRVWTHSLEGQRIEGTLVSADSAAVTLVPKSSQPLLGGELRLPASDVCCAAGAKPSCRRRRPRRPGSSASLEIEGLRLRIETLDRAPQSQAIPPLGLRIVLRPRG